MRGFADLPAGASPRRFSIAVRAPTPEACRGAASTLRNGHPPEAPEGPSLALTQRRRPADRLGRHRILRFLRDSSSESACGHGTSYRAAIWIHVGQFQEDKLDANQQCPSPLMNILLEPLETRLARPPAALDIVLPAPRLARTFLRPEMRTQAVGNRRLARRSEPRGYLPRRCRPSPTSPATVTANRASGPSPPFGASRIHSRWNSPRATRSGETTSLPNGCRDGNTDGFVESGCPRCPNMP